MDLAPLGGGRGLGGLDGRAQVGQARAGGGDEILDLPLATAARLEPVEGPLEADDPRTQAAAGPVALMPGCLEVDPAGLGGLVGALRVGHDLVDQRQQDRGGDLGHVQPTLHVVLAQLGALELVELHLGQLVLVLAAGGVDLLGELPVARILASRLMVLRSSLAWTFSALRSRFAALRSSLFCFSARFSSRLALRSAFLPSSLARFLASASSTRWASLACLRVSLAASLASVMAVDLSAAAWARSPARLSR
ncbi:hypothetical protein A6035_17575 (plasmid) [Dietzia lutea]|uniref:Uncharacterized protein n=1 Tax=Dietzia lutea TaxID=546160 RepID=A0A2S1RCX2_9ACTN|nr:hypothetical protein A6035_17575 [Dietzia lutea]